MIIIGMETQLNCVLYTFFVMLICFLPRGEVSEGPGQWTSDPSQLYLEV